MPVRAIGTAFACSVLVMPLMAQQPKPLYEIKKEQIQKGGRSEDRVYLTRLPDAQGKPTLYVNLQFKIVRPDGQLAEDVNPEEIRVEENHRRVENLKVQTPSALETLTTILAIDISGSMAEHGKMEQAK